MAQGSFALQLANFEKLTAKQAKLSCQKIAMEVFERVIMRSPVGNPELWSAEFNRVGKALGWFDEHYVGGRFRANWGVQIGAKYEGTTDSKDQSGTTTVSAAQMETLGWNGVGSIYMCNNLPYSIPLEYGHSHIQAPQGMVRVVVAEMQAGLAEQVAKP